MRGILIGAAVVLLALAVYLLNRRGEAMSVLHGPGEAWVKDNPDLAVLQQLRHAGSDLTKPHAIEFFLYFPSEQAARQAVARLAPRGYDASAQRGADDSSWLCHVTRTMVPDHAALLEARQEFSGLAAELHGEYDGWGTPVVK